MSWEQICFFESGAVLVLTVLTLWVAVITPGTNQWNKKFFITLFAVFVLSMTVMLIDLVVYDDPSMALAERIVVGFEYLLLSIPTPMFTTYLLRTCKEDSRKSSLLRTVVALWGMYFILLAIAQFTTFFYYVTPDNQYVRGSWHSIMIAPIFAEMFINLSAVICRRNKLPRKYFVVFMIHLLPLQVALFVSCMITVTLEFVVLGLCISTLAMFAIILHDQIEQYVGQQRDDEHLLPLREESQKGSASHAGFYDLSAQELHRNSKRRYDSLFRRVGTHPRLSGR